MWLLLTRAPPPDAADWPGRRLLGAIDAVCWPALAFYGLEHMARMGGIVVAVAMVAVVAWAVRGLFTALLVNHRYRFTTWKIGRPLLWLLAFGAGLKLLIH